MPFDAARLRQLACVALSVLGTAGPVGAQDDARAQLAEQGIYWQSMGRIELAEASWRKLLSADPRSADALYGMSQVELARGNTEAARNWIARLRAAHPGDARASAFESRMSRRAAPKANSTVAEGEGTPVSRRAAPKANSTAAGGEGTSVTRPRLSRGT